MSLMGSYILIQTYFSIWELRGREIHLIMSTRIFTIFISEYEQFTKKKSCYYVLPIELMNKFFIFSSTHASNELDDYKFRFFFSLNYLSFRYFYGLSS